MEGGIRASESLLALGELPTGIVCSNDMTAIGVLHGLFRFSSPVPQDVSVVGFDDIHLAQFMLPPLTTVQMSCKHLAVAAVQALRAGIEPGHPQAQQREWHISTQLVVRQSIYFPTRQPSGTGHEIPCTPPRRKYSLGPSPPELDGAKAHFAPASYPPQSEGILVTSDRPFVV